MRQKGFSFVELIAVMVIAAILAVTVVPRLIPSSTFQLQSTRDQLVTAIASAQQLAMHQPDLIQVSTAGNQIDIRRDANNNQSFESSESIRFGSVSYPVDIATSQSINSINVTFDRLGQVSSAQTFTLTQDGDSVSVTLSTSGRIVE